MDEHEVKSVTLHYYKLMLPLVPPACTDANVADEEAEAEAVARTIPSLSTPLLAFLLSYLCHQSSMLALHRWSGIVVF